MILSKLHKQPNGTKVLAVCDKEILGKKFEEEDLQLDLTGSFYKGVETSEKDLLLLFKSANIINLVGEKSVNLGMKAGIADEKSILIIRGIPHVQVLRR